MHRSISRFSIIAALFCSTSAFAQNGPWVVSELQGQVVKINSAGAEAAERGMRVAPGETVRTGGSGNAVLVRGREFVTVRRNTQIRIPAETGERSVIQIVQDWGSALFNIGKQPNPHFGVKTEYLAAVVKGTTFTVTVAPDGASMQVLEGAVEVSTDDGGARDLVLPGAVAMVAAGDRFRLVVEGTQRKVIDSPARPNSTAPSAPSATNQPEGAKTGSASPATASTAAPSSEPLAPQSSALGGSGNEASVTPARFITSTLGHDGADLSKLSRGLIEGNTRGFTSQVVAEAAVLAGRGRGAQVRSGQDGNVTSGSGSGGTSEPTTSSGPAGPSTQTSEQEPSKVTAQTEDLSQLERATEIKSPVTELEGPIALIDSDPKIEPVIVFEPLPNVEDVEDEGTDPASAAKEAEEAAKDAAKDAKDAAKDAAKEAEDAAKEAEKAAKDAAKDAEDAAKEAEGAVREVI